jgi:hypothetical protein
LVLSLLQGTCGTLALAVLLSVDNAQLGLSAEEGAKQSGSSEKLPPAVMLRTHEMAALIVAYEDYRTWLKSYGVDLTLPEFIKRHHAVRVRREGPQIHSTSTQARS